MLNIEETFVQKISKRIKKESRSFSERTMKSRRENNV